MSARTTLRSEAGAQIALMLGVGSVAACASWSHVVDLANRHGQPGWLAVADAAVLETLAVSMGLEVRRRRGSGEGVLFAGTVLVTAVALQLAAQVAQAPRTFWGWTMAALPAVGFLVLAKTAIGRSAPDPEVRRAPAVDRPALSPAALPESHPVPGPKVVDRPSPGHDRLLTTARLVAQDLAHQGVGLTRAALVGGLRSRGVKVGTGRAGQLLATLREERPPAPDPASRSLAATP